jgi:hypothetical protein
MHSSSLVGEFTTEIFAVPEWVEANNSEIMRQAAILLRLVKTMDGDARAREAYDELLGRVAGRLSNCLGIFELYMRNDEADLRASCVEFEKAVSDREVLRVRKQVGDIGDEEFGLKMAVAEWSIGSFGARKKELEGGVRAMSGLREQFDAMFVDEISRIAEGDYRKIRELRLPNNLADVVIGCLGRLVDKLG